MFAIGRRKFIACSSLNINIRSTSAKLLLQTSKLTDLRGFAVSMFIFAMRGATSLGGLTKGVLVNLLKIWHALLLNGIAVVIIAPLIAVKWLAVVRTRYP